MTKRMHSENGLEIIKVGNNMEGNNAFQKGLFQLPENAECKVTKHTNWERRLIDLCLATCSKRQEDNSKKKNLKKRATKIITLIQQYAQHLINHGHSLVNMEDVMDVIFTTHKEKHLDTVEKYHI
jgi:hypothetical protein